MFLENRNIQREEIINDNDNDKPNSPFSITRSCDCSLNLARLFPQYCLYCNRKATSLIFFILGKQGSCYGVLRRKVYSGQ